MTTAYRHIRADELQIGDKILDDDGQPDRVYFVAVNGSGVYVTLTDGTRFDLNANAEVTICTGCQHWH